MSESDKWARLRHERLIRGSAALNPRDTSPLPEEAVQHWLQREGYASATERSVDGNFPLHTACSRGKLGIVHYLIANGASVDVKATVSGFTPLHFAAIRNKERTVRWLVNECGATVDIEASGGTTPMMCAAHAGNLAVMKLLLSRGATFANRRKPMVAIAASRGHLDTIRWLHDQGCELDALSRSGTSALMHAAAKGHKHVLTWLAKKGCDLNRTNNDGDTALSLACEYGRRSIVKWLIKHGADVSHTNRYGLFPLSLAASNGHVSLIEWLLANGCPLETRHYPMRSVTMTTAARHGQLKVVQYLVTKCGVSPLAIDGLGKSAVQYACEKGHLDVLKYFVEQCNVTLDHRGSRGRTLAILAAHYGRLDILRYIYSVNPQLLLLRDAMGTSILSYALDNMQSGIVHWLVSHGCLIGGSQPEQNLHSSSSLPVVPPQLRPQLQLNPTADPEENADQNTAAPTPIAIIDGIPLMHSAIASGTLSMVEFLVDCGAPIDFVDQHGYNSACLAIRYSRLSVLKWLVKRGASLEVVSYSGNTPMMLAASTGHLPMFTWLLSQGCTLSGKNLSGGDVQTFARSSPAILNFLQRIGWSN